MKPLPYDTARCLPAMHGCERKAECARHTSPGRPNGWQTVCDFTSVLDKGEECSAFIDNGGADAHA